MTSDKFDEAARWAEDEFQRRTRLLEENSPEARVDWVHPDYRVCWSEVAAKFFNDASISYIGLRTGFEEARQKIRRSKR